LSSVGIVIFHISKALIYLRHEADLFNTKIFNPKYFL
jgi:hypothetical protein